MDNPSSSPCEPTRSVHGELISDTHQQVWRRDDGRIVKTWGDGDWDPVLELSVLGPMYGDVRIERADGRDVLVMPDWGVPLPAGDIDDRMAARMGAVLAQVHALPAPAILPDEDRRQRVTDRALYRIDRTFPFDPEEDRTGSEEERQTLQYRKTADDFVWWMLEDTPPMVGDTLVHCDPHAGNWLTDADGGTLRLIDWESACRGPRETDLGNALLDDLLGNYRAIPLFWGYLDTSGLTPADLDVDQLAAAFSAKIASSTIHQLWRYGADAYGDRVQLLMDTGLYGFENVHDWTTTWLKETL